MAGLLSANCAVRAAERQQLHAYSAATTQHSSASRQLPARRAVIAALFASSGLALVGCSAAAESVPKGPTSIDISMAPKGAAEYMRRRDDAMDFKCKGGMFDCDGDRREFAKKQFQEFQERGGKKKPGPKSY